MGPIRRGRGCYLTHQQASCIRRSHTIFLSPSLLQLTQQKYKFPTKRGERESDEREDRVTLTQQSCVFDNPTKLFFFCPAAMPLQLSISITLLTSSFLFHMLPHSHLYILLFFIPVSSIPFFFFFQFFLSFSWIVVYIVS